MAKSSFMDDYYSLLGVDFDATLEQIEQAYQDKLDQVQGRLSYDKEARQQYKQLQQAYRVLHDPQKRKFYDKFYVLSMQKQGKELTSPRARRLLEELNAQKSQTQKAARHSDLILVLLSFVMVWGFVFYQGSVFKIVKLISFLGSLYVILVTFKQQKFFWLLTALIVSVLYNPVEPIHLKPDTWQIVNVLVGLYFGLLALILNPDKNSSQHKQKPYRDAF